MPTAEKVSDVRSAMQPYQLQLTVDRLTVDRLRATSPGQSEDWSNESYFLNFSRSGGRALNQLFLVTFGVWEANNPVFAENMRFSS
ncbi:MULTISPECIES: hypothetical protein [unclassified Microcoleus]|uniref:hypothetical protein n=1 Tax=unclassified Microcoleus TaxID=2642155 RepID=UPI002FCE71D9